MKVLQRSQRLARLATFAALSLGLAGAAVAGSPIAQARVRPWPVINRHAAVSWGTNGIGQLGNGGTADSALYVGVSGLSGSVVQVAAGGAHGLALTSGRTVWAWGSNAAGQLGNGTFTSSSTPVQVQGLTGVIQVSAGVDHNLALRSDGTVWTWGGNQYGELGIGTTGSAQPTPVQVPGLTGITKISAGGLFSLALRSDGTVWAWGYNQSGELGNGTTADSSVPVQVTGLTGVTNIAAGADSSLATNLRGRIVALARVWAWGSNSAGQLGDGTRTDHLTPEQVTGVNTGFVAGLAVGDGDAFVLGTDGSVWAWGADGYGQLGNGPSFTPATWPVQIFGAGSGIIQLAAGTNHVLALESNGTVLAWGNDRNGELGNGSTASTSGPVQVSGLAGASQVSASYGFSLAVYLPPWVVLAAKR